MSFSSRRSFMIRAGWTAAASLCALGKQVGARPAADDDDAPPELQFLVAPERKHIMESMAKEDIPGVSVCLIAEDKAWIEGFGVTGGNSSRRVRTDTLFSVQSTSKNFTATAILLAVQQGILDLDEPITAYLPDFTVQSRFEPVPQQMMTLRLLLSHRAGFTHEAPVGNNYEPAFPDFEAHVRSISQTWLRFPVGERYRYSNLGVDLAGLSCRFEAECLLRSGLGSCCSNHSGCAIAQPRPTYMFDSKIGPSGTRKATRRYL